MAAMHHRVSDAIADPPGAQAHHSERLLRLAGGFLCYLPPADAPAILPSPAPAPGAVTFGSFNNFSKLSPATLRLWAAILHALPSARLVLKAKQSSDPETVARLAGAFATAGIDSARLEFRRTQRTPAEHLASYCDIDIALDPFPYNGTTTSCEAMWMGVPVIALAGSAHAGRVGASLLTRVGLADLLAANEESYLRIATALAHDLPRLAALRDGLRERMRPGLGDAARFAREMEEAYRAAWAEWLSAR
jgi:predicted O-linked N-acetylglucosamine transferase (SPINDLY family)